MVYLGRAGAKIREETVKAIHAVTGEDPDDLNKAQDNVEHWGSYLHGKGKIRPFHGKYHRIRQDEGQLFPTHHLQRQHTQINSHRTRTPSSNMPYMRRGRRRFRRYRRRYRGRRSFKKGVIRNALKLHESKRFTREITGVLQPRHPAAPAPIPNAPRVYYFEMANVDRWSNTDDTIEQIKNHRTGRFTYAVGTKVSLYLKNTYTASDMTQYVRIILGYKKLDRENENSNEFYNGTDSAAIDASNARYRIFKETVSENNCYLEQWRTNGTLTDRQRYQTMEAVLDKKYIAVYKDIKLKLLGPDTADTNGDIYHANIYWPHKNRMIKWESDSTEKTDDVNWMPAMWIYTCSGEMVDISAQDTVQMTCSVTHYFKDPY